MKNVYMKKIITIIIILLLYSNQYIPTLANEIQQIQVVAPQPKETITTAIENNNEDEFAPIDLDLTDYTTLNKKNKRFKLSVEKVTKPQYVKNTNQIWSEDKLFLQD